MDQKPQKKISLKIKRQIRTYQVIKNSAADEVKTFKSADGKGVEFVYPELSPEASFKIILKSSLPNTENDIDIIYANGKVVKAIDAQNFEAHLFVIYSITAILWISWMIYIARKEAIEGLERNSKLGYTCAGITAKKRPWYVSTTKWEDVKTTAFTTYIKSTANIYHVKSIKSFNSYKFIVYDQPLDNISPEKKEELKETAISSLKDSLLRKCQIVYNYQEILDLMDIEHPPESFPDNEWSDLRKKISELYLAKKLNNFLIGYSKLEELLLEIQSKKPNFIDDNSWEDYKSECTNVYLYKLKMSVFESFNTSKELVKILSKPNPEGILQEHWEKAVNYFKGYLYCNYLDEIHSSAEPLAFIEKCRLNLLNDRMQSYLKEAAYNLQMTKLLKVFSIEGSKSFIENERPKWMSEQDYTTVLKIAKKNHKLDEKVEEYDNKNKLLSDELAITNNKKEKIINQLKFINDFLSDPSSINRVEEYEKLFEPGNYANLKKLSGLFLKLTL